MVLYDNYQLNHQQERNTNISISNFLVVCVRYKCNENNTVFITLSQLPSDAVPVADRLLQVQ